MQVAELEYLAFFRTHLPAKAFVGKRHLAKRAIILSILHRLWPTAASLKRSAQEYHYQSCHYARHTAPPSDGPSVKHDKRHDRNTDSRKGPSSCIRYGISVE